MSLTEQQMMDVMALADGELEGDALARTQKLVEENAEAKELVASLGALGDGVRSAHATDVGAIDLRDAVMAKVTPNDLDKARIKRTARTRMLVVGGSLVALAAAVLLYIRDVNTTHAVNTSSADASVVDPATQLASAAATGVQVDFVDTPTPVSVFYLPAETTGGETEGKTETPATTVVWVDDSMVASPP